MQKSHEKDRFGIHEDNLRAATKVLKKRESPFLCCVPSRREVATFEYQELEKILIEWMCHSPTEIIPSRTEIVEVKSILLQRQNLAQLSNLITMCNYYIQCD